MFEKLVNCIADLWMKIKYNGRETSSINTRNLELKIITDKIIQGQEETRKIKSGIQALKELTNTLNSRDEELKESRRRLRIQNEIMTEICDNIDAMVWAKDVEGKYIFVSKLLCNRMKQTREYIIGKTDFQLIADDKFVFKKISTDNITIESKIPCRFIYNLNSELIDGYFDVYKKPIFIDDKLYGLAAIVWEVTHDK